MDTFIIEIAGFHIKIILREPIRDFLKKEYCIILHKYLENFIIQRSGRKPDAIIEIIEEPVKIIKKTIDGDKVFFMSSFTERGYLHYVTSYEHKYNTAFQLVLKIIINRLLSNCFGFIVHGSAVLVNSKANIFIGESGAGKSTVISLLKEKYEPLADDNILIRKVGREYFCFQVPFVENEDFIIKKRKGLQIGKLFFLHKSRSVKMDKITSSEAVMRFTENVFLNSRIREQMNTVIVFTSVKNSFYDLYFSKDKEKLQSLIESRK